MINMTSSAPGWSHISSSPFGQNVEFTYPNGTVIPSWLENYTSSRAIWWVKLASYGSQTIFMDFVPISTNLFNTVNTGEAPQLSSTYGEYDNGANVFESYDNFSGTQLNSAKFRVSAVGGVSGGTVVVNNGLSIVVSTTDAVAVLTKNTYQIYNRYFGFGAAPPNWPPPNFALIESNGVIADMPGFNYYDNAVYVVNDIGQSSSLSIANTVSNSIYLFLINNNTQQACLNINFGNAVCVNLNNYAYVNPDYIGLLQSYEGGATFGPIYYFFITSTFPNGIMPSVTFGSVS